MHQICVTAETSYRQATLFDKNIQGQILYKFCYFEKIQSFSYAKGGVEVRVGLTDIARPILGTQIVIEIYASY